VSKADGLDLSHSFRPLRPVTAIALPFTNYNRMLKFEMFSVNIHTSPLRMFAILLQTDSWDSGMNGPDMNNA
jgi:hypothetical protein